MTRKEIFADRLEVSGDFWRVVQDLVNEGWNLGDLEDAGVVQDLYGFTDSTFEENLEFLKGLLRVRAANTAGAAWMERALTECDGPEEWSGVNYQDFLQALANANSPAFPTFDTPEETDAAYDGAWDQLGFGMKLHAQDKVYQEGLEKRKTEGWKDYDGK